MDIKNRVRELEPELIALRRDFHRHPELGFEEYRTQEKIIEYLEKQGIDVKKMGGTGVALPVREETGHPFASEEEG
jgi:metal-dependent amidase/aminoacylase/carboxypeptidase family protein